MNNLQLLRTSMADSPKQCEVKKQAFPLPLPAETTGVSPCPTFIMFSKREI